VLQQGSQNQNPLYDFANFSYTTKGQRFLGGSTLKYDPANWVTLEGNFSFDRGASDYTQFRDRGFRTTTFAPATNLGTLAQGADDDQSLNASFATTLRRSFGDLRMSAVGKYLYEQQYNTGLDLAGNELVVPGLVSANAVVNQDTRSFGSSRTRTTGVALIGSLVADYKDRYLVQANLRRDGSSRFGSGNRWATFPGLSGSWIVSREPWWGVKDAVSLFKLRAAYGQTGNRPSFVAQYATFTLGAGGQLNPSQLGNPDLRPEVRTETEYGVDLELYGRYGLNLTYADNNIRNQILLVPQSFGSGFINQWQNAGTLQNRSFEGSLNIPVVNRPNVGYSATLIATRLRSRITQLNVEPFFVGNTNLQGAERIIRIAEGEYMGTMYGRDFIRSCSQLPGAFRGQCSGSSWRRERRVPTQRPGVHRLGRAGQLARGGRHRRTCGARGCPPRRRRTARSRGTGRRPSTGGCRSFCATRPPGSPRRCRSAGRSPRSSTACRRTSGSGSSRSTAWWTRR
jgi:hypothetical protein